MLEKLEETLRSNSQSLMLKASEDSTKVWASAIEAKRIMDECKWKVVKIEKLAETINSLEKKRKEFDFDCWFFFFFKLLSL